MLLPTLFAGLYLRRLLVLGGTEGRSGVADHEKEALWQSSAPHLLAVWTLVIGGIGLLNGAEVMSAGELSLSGWLEDCVVDATLSLWILTALVHSRKLEAAIGPAIAIMFTVFFCIIALKFALYFTRFLVDFGWSFLFSLVGVNIPEWLKNLVDELVEMGAQLFFFSIMLGYGWVNARRQFLSWVTVYSSRVSEN
ncbi:MAG TPA: hypothetical protein EYQ50_05680 [Verrucomicrobiales bacterium]|nr:hypothetical protein [Verrucomicrobiales bacterium]HIL72494.1 hypothetical protein [Verrucomicrobiota bacterium]